MGGRTLLVLDAIGALALIVLTACPVAVPAPSQIAAACTSDVDCLAGTRCDQTRRLCLQVDGAIAPLLDASAGDGSDGSVRDATADAAPADRADAAMPDHADAAQPDHADAALPDHADAAQPDHADAAQPDHADAAQPDRIDAAVPDSAPYCRPPQPDTCDSTCVDLQSDLNHCGWCDHDCTGTLPLCCGGNCFDGDIDADHCGSCNPCGPGIECRGGQCLDGCVDGTVEQVFASDMLGCAGFVSWSASATLCRTGWRTCSAQEWVNRHAGIAPEHNYWTSDSLRYESDIYGCYVLYSGGHACDYSTVPMRVCTSTQPDPEGNDCNWTDCGFGASSPNEYFGGCNGNNTAGTLCCR